MRPKWSKSEENHEAQFLQFSAFIGQNRYFVFIAFKILQMEFQFKYTILITKL